jgi:hypothetical protein
MSKLLIKKVYLSADALFDLRQGTLAYIDLDYSIDVTTKPSYYNREEDLFESTTMGKLDKELYNRIRSERQDNIVRLSMTTAIFEFLLSLCAEYKKQAILTPFLSDIEIEVNLYPFVFSDNEKDEILKCILEKTSSSFNVTLVNLSPDDMSVEYVRNNYVAMIMYEYAEWYNAHVEAIQKTPLIEVGIYIPKLYFLKKPDEKDLVDFKKHNTNPFDFMAQALSAFTVIQYLPISFYCANTPLNLSEYRQLKK